MSLAPEHSAKLSGCTGYLAAEGFERLLRDELRDVTASHGRMILAEGGPQRAFWSQNIWYEPVIIPIASIKDAAAKLRSLQRNWWPYAFHLHRRTELIHAELPHVGVKPLVFPSAPPTAPLGSFMLLDAGKLLAAPRCQSAFPNGKVRFVEDKSGPPSRAYLKLWEALTLAGRHPRPGERCIELGASPGGWTWVIARLGASVLAIDRAPLADEVAAMPGVTFRRGDAFSLKPENVDTPIDWLFSDVICYPEKLHECLRAWIESGRCANVVCTVKFQGAKHYGICERFAAIPGAALRHLSHNKHELTFMRLHE